MLIQNLRGKLDGGNEGGKGTYIYG
jgi:hypothetical protein